ncbi:MAG: hypothetical protein BWZ04_01247 [Firmicutes bacterium ADurb.BinA205]|nr:MAG: hypothetical protein BWZ04_01247 [Firmicutes bacterium ADurb.BinA205]
MKKIFRFILLLAAVNMIGRYSQQEVSLPTLSQAVDFAVTAVKEIREVLLPYYTI